MSATNLSKGERDFELKRLSHDSGEYSDEDDGEDVLEEDALRHGPRRVSDSSIESFELYTPDEERAVVRKLDVNVVLFMSFLYLLSFLDRTNIGNAKIAGMERDLQLREGQFDWLLTAFYISYILFEWMIMLYHFLTPSIYIAVCVMSWGLVASLQAIATSFPAMIVLRVLLGIGEAAFSPGVPFFLSMFYRREELALRAGIQVSAAPLASSFAGSLAYVITKFGAKSALAPWRLLFLVEGFPGIIVAFIAWRHVPDSPETAKFLTPRQRKIAGMRLRRETRDESGSVHAMGKSFKSKPLAMKTKQKKKIDWDEIGSTLKDPKCYLTALMFSSSNIAFSSMPVFLPTILQQMGYTDINAQGLSAPVFLVAFVVMLLIARASDKLKTRSTFVCFAALLSCSGYLLIAAGGYYHWPERIRYACLYAATSGFFSVITIVITWTMNNQETNASKGVGMTILNVIGQCGPLIGTRLFPESDKPTYVRGMLACAAAMLFVFVLAVILRVVLVFENRRRRRDHLRSSAASDELRRSGESVPGRSEPFILML